MRSHREFCAAKLASCVRLAREANRNSWQAENRRMGAAYAQISIEAMQDARYWRDQLKNQ